MSTAQVALDIAGASLSVSVTAIVANVATWVRSGPRLRVRLTRLEHEHGRLKDVVRGDLPNGIPEILEYLRSRWLEVSVSD